MIVGIVIAGLVVVGGVFYGLIKIKQPTVRAEARAGLKMPCCQRANARRGLPHLNPPRALATLAVGLLYRPDHCHQSINHLEMITSRSLPSL